MRQSELGDSPKALKLSDGRMMRIIISIGTVIDTVVVSHFIPLR